MLMSQNLTVLLTSHEYFFAFVVFSKSRFVSPTVRLALCLLRLPYIFSVSTCIFSVLLRIFPVSFRLLRIYVFDVHVSPLYADGMMGLAQCESSSATRRRDGSNSRSVVCGQSTGASGSS